MKPSKETVEKAKTIFIVIVITAGVMFPLGMSYQSSIVTANIKAVEQAVRSAQSTATVETPVKK